MTTTLALELNDAGLQLAQRIADGERPNCWAKKAPAVAILNEGKVLLGTEAAKPATRWRRCMHRTASGTNSD